MMKAEQLPRDERVDREISRLRERLSGRFELPETRVLRQSGPFQSQSQFVESAMSSFRALLSYTGLTPGSRVLDFGCGQGRLALPLSEYLDPEQGEYRGVDVDADCIARNREAFRASSHMSFKHIDGFSERYNPDGGGWNRFRFAGVGRRFDLAFLFSVFSHVLPEDCDLLLRQLHQRLKPGGEILTTWYLLNERTLQAIDQGLTRRSFAVPYNGARIDSEKVPEAAVAFDAGDVVRRFEARGFTDITVRHGAWRGTLDSWIWQDFITARKAI
jgi:SAM-dependent methyltransferase